MRLLRRPGLALLSLLLFTRMFTAGYTRTSDRTNVFGGNWRGIIPFDAYDWVVVLGPTTPTTPTTLLEMGTVASTKDAR